MLCSDWVSTAVLSSSSQRLAGSQDVPFKVLAPKVAVLNPLESSHITVCLATSRLLEYLTYKFVYTEVVEILEKTGGTPYFDKAAAAKYMVYDGHSWIS